MTDCKRTQLPKAPVVAEEPMTVEVAPSIMALNSLFRVSELAVSVLVTSA